MAYILRVPIYRALQGKLIIIIVTLICTNSDILEIVLLLNLKSMSIARLRVKTPFMNFQIVVFAYSVKY